MTVGGYRNPEDESDLTAEELLWVQSGSAGILLLEEQASSPSSTTSFGKVYVKTDGNLYYLNESGVEIQLGSGGGMTIEIPGGSVNASNVSFTVTAEPNYVVSDGITYFDGAGYSYAGLVITMDIPPSSYIRAII